MCERIASDMDVEAKRWQEVAEKNQAHFEHLAAAMEKVTPEARLLQLCGAQERC